MHRGSDLKSKPVQPLHARVLRMRRADEFWEIDLCTTDGLSSFQEFSTLCQTLSRRLQTQDVFLLGSVSLHDLRTANLSREFTRHRSLPASATNQALPSRHSRQSVAQYPGPCELGPRLAHLCRLCAGADYPRPSALCRRQLRRRVGPDCLRTRCHHHRFVPGAFSLGQVSQAQRSGEAAHPARPARQHSNCGDHYTWQDSRGQYSGSTQLRGRRVLCNGSRLPRFRSLVQVALGLRLLCYPRQKALRFPAPLFTTSGSSYRSDLRSDGYARQSGPAPGLPREVASHSLLRCPNQSTTRLSNQQLQLATTDYRPTVSQPLAGGIVLQMDQATPTHQEFLRHFRKRFANSNLDCDLGLRARGHCEKGIAARRQSLQNVTDLQRHSFRENPYFTGPFFSRRSNRLRRSLQTTDSVPLTLGQYCIRIYNAKDALLHENVEIIRDADLLLLDLMIPPAERLYDADEMPGVDVLRRLRQDHKVQTPVVVFSVSQNVRILKQLEPWGIADF